MLFFITFEQVSNICPLLQSRVRVRRERDDGSRGGNVQEEGGRRQGSRRGAREEGGNRREMNEAFAFPRTENSRSVIDEKDEGVEGNLSFPQLIRGLVRYLIIKDYKVKNI